MVGYCSKDVLPSLGKAAGAFTAVRAAAHNVLSGKRSSAEHPTYLKSREMNDRGYVTPTLKQVERIVALMQQMWVEKATEWWSARLRQDPSLARYATAIDRLMLRPRTTLQVEAYLCEVLNRLMKARAFKDGTSERGTKAYWRPTGVHKDLSSVNVSYSDGNGGCVLERGVQLV